MDTKLYTFKISEFDMAKAIMHDSGYEESVVEEFITQFVEYEDPLLHRYISFKMSKSQFQSEVMFNGIEAAVREFLKMAMGRCFKLGSLVKCAEKYGFKNVLDELVRVGAIVSYDISNAKKIQSSQDVISVLRDELQDVKKELQDTKNYINIQLDLIKKQLGLL